MKIRSLKDTEAMGSTSFLGKGGVKDDKSHTVVRGED